MNDPGGALPLSYQPRPPATAGSRGMKMAGSILMIMGAAGFACTIVGIALAFRAVRASPSPTPAQLAMGMSRSLCLSMVGIIFIFIGLHRFISHLVTGIGPGEGCSLWPRGGLLAMFRSAAQSD